MYSNAYSPYTARLYSQSFQRASSTPSPRCPAHALHVVWFGHSPSILPHSDVTQAPRARSHADGKSQTSDARSQMGSWRYVTGNQRRHRKVEVGGNNCATRLLISRTICSIRIRRFFPTLCYATQRIVFSPSNCKTKVPSIHPSVSYNTGNAY